MCVEYTHHGGGDGGSIGVGVVVAGAGGGGTFGGGAKVSGRGRGPIPSSGPLGMKSSSRLLSLSWRAMGQRQKPCLKIDLILRNILVGKDDSSIDFSPDL